MDTFDSLYLIIGVIAIGVGIYCFITNNPTGRKDMPKGSEKEFVRLDGITYIVEGIIAVVLSGGGYLPVLKSAAVQFVGIALALIGIGLNVYFANKIRAKY